MNKFWNFIQNETGERVLRLDGAISDITWFDDEITPQQFRDELNFGEGDITVWINSPGGDVFAATEIYNLLKEYIRLQIYDLGKLSIIAVIILVISYTVSFICGFGY